MSTIYSGVGLVSGIDIQALVDGLIAADSRPRDLLLRRISKIDAQRTAFLDISARISAILSRVTSLKSSSAFQAATAASANPAVIAPTVSAGAVPGTYSFLVQSLATRHQLVSRGFQSADAPLGAGSVTIESSQARVNAQTRLDHLNGFVGVQRGAFKITDASGVSATISISDALTLQDVVERVNAASVAVSAEIDGDHLVLRETSGGALRISEVDGAHVAADLGFDAGRTYSATGQLNGSDLVFLAGGTQLARLNDGNGVRRAAAGGDFTVSGDGFDTFTVDLSGLLTIDTHVAQLNHGAAANFGVMRITTTDADGTQHASEVDLTGLQTVGQIRDAIQAAVPGLTVTLAGNPGRLIVGYSDNSARALKIEDVSGTAARDLGITGDVTTGKIDGRQILYMDTVQDVVNAINYANGNTGAVTAATSGPRLTLSSTGGGNLTLARVGASMALADLGLSETTYAGTASGRRLLAGIDSTLLHTLNGGKGLAPGTIRIQCGASELTLDLSGAESLGEIVRQINGAASGAGMNIEAGFDATGTRLQITSIDGVTPLTITDVSGQFAVQAGIASTGTTIRGANLQKQYIAETTLLSSLDGGAGVSLGKIKVTNSLGLVRTIDLAVGSVTTVGDVLYQINTLQGELGISARINDTGDGIIVSDASGGTLALKIEDSGGSVARGLRIAGEFADHAVDGAFEERYEVTGSSSLNDLVSRINAASRLATASVLNDGNPVNPMRLQLTSSASGLTGELLVDGAALGLDLTTLSRAQDARVVVGSGQDGILLTSASNTLTNVVPGLTINLTGISEQAVAVTVSQDMESLVSTISGLVSSYNSAIDRIDQLSSYNSETEERGILLGDGTLLTLESRLSRLVTRRAEGALNLLSQVGLRLESGQLVFDEQKFRDALAADPDAVSELFTDPADGLAAWMESQLKAITDTTGLIDRREESLQKQKDLLSKRVDQMNELLDLKRARLMRQFAAMEQALSELQAQQSALTQLSALSATG